MDIKPRVLSTTINEDDAAASLSLAMEVCGYFELDGKRAKQISTEVGKAVLKWRNEAVRFGLSKSEVDWMASGFDHEDLKMALGK